MILANNLRSKQNLKNPEHHFVEIGKLETSAKFEKKNKKIKSTVDGARQSFQFFRKSTWFLENSRALSKFLHGIWHYLIIITKLSKQSIKPNFILAM